MSKRTKGPTGPVLTLKLLKNSPTIRVGDGWVTNGHWAIKLSLLPAWQQTLLRDAEVAAAWTRRDHADALTDAMLQRILPGKILDLEEVHRTEWLNTFSRTQQRIYTSTNKNMVVALDERYSAFLGRRSWWAAGTMTPLYDTNKKADISMVVMPMKFDEEDVAPMLIWEEKRGKK